MDTTSNTLAVTLSLLAEHPEVQEKLRNEILGAFDPEDDYDYDTLMSLPYLEAVCRESLRLYVVLKKRLTVHARLTWDIQTPPYLGCDPGVSVLRLFLTAIMNAQFHSPLGQPRIS